MLTSPENKNLHVFAMCEIKLKEHKLANTLKNGVYQPFRGDNLKSGGGGIIVYVRNDMNVTRKKKQLEINDIDCLWLDITPCRGKSF